MVHNAGSGDFSVFTSTVNVYLHIIVIKRVKSELIAQL